MTLWIISIRLEAVASRLEAIAIRLEAMAIRQAKQQVYNTLVLGRSCCTVFPTLASGKVCVKAVNWRGSCHHSNTGFLHKPFCREK